MLAEAAPVYAAATAEVVGVQPAETVDTGATGVEVVLQELVVDVQTGYVSVHGQSVTVRVVADVTV